MNLAMTDCSTISKKDKGIEMSDPFKDIDTSNVRVQDLDIGYLIDQSRSGERLILISEFSPWTRPGTQLFATRVEFEHFPPTNEELSNSWDLAMVNWQSIVWTVISVPIRYSNDLRKIAAECGLRFADGIPTIVCHPDQSIGEGKIVKGMRVIHFPVDGKYAYHLENHGESPVGIYQGLQSPDIQRAQRRREIQLINQVRRRHGAKEL